jgi:hypothetical protein
MLLSRQDLITATATGAATLIDPSRLSPRLRTGYRLGLSAFTAAAAYHVSGQPTEGEDDEVLPPAGRAGIAAALAALVYGTFRGAEKMDAASVAWLGRRGVKRPRVALAVAGTALTLGMSALERWEEQRKASVPADEQVEVTPDPAKD